MSKKSNEQFLLTTLIETKRSEIAYPGKVQEYFELFSAEQVLKKYDLSYDELDRGIIDGADDGKIDSIYIIVDKELIEDDTGLTLRKNSAVELHIIQSKYTNGFSEDVVTVLGRNLSELLQLSTDIKTLKSGYSKLVIEKFEIFRESYKKLITRFPSLLIHVHYCTYAEDAHPKVSRRAESLKTELQRLFTDAKVEFSFWGAKQMLELARSAAPTSFNLELVENPITTIRGGYVCLASLSAYAKFISDESGNLRRDFFEANVRDYQGEVPVNEEIRATLSSAGDEDFWWLNNGVTIICTKVSYAGKVLTIENPEIVNGLQTSTVIHGKFPSGVPLSEQRNVLIRVIKPGRDESRDRIIKATNSQTKMPASSLRATDPIHRNIEDFLKTKGYFYDRRKNHYKNLGKAPLKIISLPFLAQCIMAIALHRPNDARARPSSVLNSDEDYKAIFNPNYPLSLYSNCVVLVRTVEIFLLSKSNELDYGDRNNLKFYLAMMAAQRFCERKTNLLDIFAMVEEQSIKTANFEKDYLKVESEYRKFGGNDGAAKGRELLLAING